jgi:hypothetical protein
MSKLNRAALWSLEDYAEQRPEFRAQVIAHKKNRRIALGAHATFYFEDFLTMKYQVQEILRTERIFDGAEIEEELEAYNPLIPDGGNLKATFMIEYSDENERREALAGLVGVEHKLWMQVGDSERIFAIANEDLERSTDDKTSAVHFLRFELDPARIEAMRSGAPVVFGADHPNLTETATLSEAQQQSLAADFD